jgi:hypothetical protein
VSVQFAHSAIGFQVGRLHDAPCATVPAPEGTVGGWNFVVVLFLSVMLHLLVVNSIRLRLNPFPFPASQGEPLEVTLQRAIPDTVNENRQPERPAPVSRSGPAPRLKTQAPVAPRNRERAPELPPAFYTRLQTGQTMESIAAEARAHQRYQRRFQQPVSPFNNHVVITPAADGSVENHRLDDGTIRVVLYDKHGKKHCFDARPDDLLDEFDLGGYFMAVIGGC